MLYAPLCVIWTTIKNPIFCFYPLLKELNRQPQSAADQILSVRSEKNMPCSSWFEMASLCRVTWKSGERVSCCAWHVYMYAYGYTLPKLSLLLRMDQYSWHVLPLCRINSDGEKQPLTASVHSAFLRHCMKIDGFDIISKASLSHMPAVEGTGGDQLAILAIAVMEEVVFQPTYLLLYFCMIINIFDYNLIHKHISSFCKSSDPKHSSSNLCI